MTLNEGKRSSQIVATGTNLTKEKVNDRKAEAMQNKDSFIEQRKQLQFSPHSLKEEISF